MKYRDIQSLFSVTAEDNISTAMFHFVYGREPNAEEVDRLSLFAPWEKTLGAFRTIIGAFDRQTHPTRVNVRFDREELLLKQFGGFKLWLDRLDFAVSSGMIVDDQHEPHLTNFMRENIRPGMTVVDIGANIGAHTMLAASLVGKDGRVLAFEPNSENCRMILLSLAENGFESNVSLFPVALSDKADALLFSPAIGSNGVLLPSKTETLFDPNCIVVPAMRLDDIVNETVNFLKADIEGAEYLALKGGEKIIRDCRPIIIVELSMEMIKRQSGIDGLDFIKWIQGFGYSGFILGKMGEPEPIGDLSSFHDRWGDFLRIEDIAFLPNSM